MRTHPSEQCYQICGMCCYVAWYGNVICSTKIVEHNAQQQKPTGVPPRWGWALRKVGCTQTLPLSCKDGDAVYKRLSAQKKVFSINILNMFIFM